MPLDLQQLIAQAKRKLAAQELAKKQAAEQKQLARRTIDQLLNDILQWENTGLVFQELHQTCSCCNNQLVSVNAVMLERSNKSTYAIRTSLLPANHSLDLQKLPRKKLVIEQQVPMCPECFQLSELIDLCSSPKAISLETAQKDLFL